MLGKIGNNGETVVVLLLVGSHSVSSALLNGKPLTAISETLTVCTCMLIFMGTLWLSRRLMPVNHPQPKVRTRKRRDKSPSNNGKAKKC
jgi:hypothetical protein